MLIQIIQMAIYTFDNVNQYHMPYSISVTTTMYILCDTKHQMNE